jgi:hypothetical protein
MITQAREEDLNIVVIVDPTMAAGLAKIALTSNEEQKAEKPSHIKLVEDNDEEDV